MEDVSEKLNRVRDTVVKSNPTKYKSTDIITISDLVLIFTNNDVPCDLVCAVADILSVCGECHNAWFWGKTCTERRGLLVITLKSLQKQQQQEHESQKQQQQEHESQKQKERESQITNGNYIS